MTRKDIQQGATRKHYGIFIAKKSMNGQSIKDDDDVMEYHYRDKAYTEMMASRLSRYDKKQRYVEEIQITFKRQES